MGFPIENETHGISRPDAETVQTDQQPSHPGEPERSVQSRSGIRVSSLLGVSSGPLGVSSGAARWIAVAGGLGYVPLAPGTAGSLGAALCFLVAACAIGSPSGLPLTAADWAVAARPWTVGVVGTETAALGFALLIGVVLWLGIWAAGRAEVAFGTHDDGRIVIDEVVGQWIALFPLIFLFEPGRDGFFSLLFGVVTGFVLFRVFDIWKPGAVRWAERRFKGGLGVMADDVVAGGYGAAGLAAVLTAVLAVAELLVSPSPVGAAA